MAEARARALFSIHDVMPETLGDVDVFIDRFRAAGLPLPALLVVPGRRWNRAGVHRLRSWEAEGAELVAHGWHHETEPRGLYHRLHAALLSRNVAEHLALDHDEVVALMQASHDWFGEHGLASPQTYIPPAWALGIPPRALAYLPYRCVETLGGVHLIDGARVTHRRLCLVGFEADNTLRRWALRGWNGIQRERAVRRAEPLRVAIHPRDARLCLADALPSYISPRWQAVQYRDLLI